MQHVTREALRGSVAITRKGEEDDPIGIVTKSLDELQKTVDERLKKVEGGAELKALMDRLADLEKKPNRPAGGGNADEQAEIEKKALASLLRTGLADEIKAAGEIETKAAASDNDPAGGYFVLPTVDLTIRNLLTDRYPHLIEYGTTKMQAQPFFWPAVRLHRKKAQQAIKRGVARSVRKNWGKGS